VVELFFLRLPLSFFLYLDLIYIIEIPKIRIDTIVLFVSFSEYLGYVSQIGKIRYTIV